MPKKRDETHHEFRALMAGLLREVIEEAEEKWRARHCGTVAPRSARGGALSAVSSLIWGGPGSKPAMMADEQAKLKKDLINARDRQTSKTKQDPTRPKPIKP